MAKRFIPRPREGEGKILDDESSKTAIEGQETKLEEKDQKSQKENVEDQSEQEPPGKDKEPTTATPSREIQSRNLRNKFIVSLFLGGVVIGFGNTLGRLESILSAAAVMFLYLLLSWGQVKKSPTARELFADSFYYLGFLFTFMALVWGIVDLEGDVDKIASQMGIALITTIIGMTVRIILVQFNPIVSEPEQDVMHSLGTLANQMQSLSSDFNSNLAQSISHLTKYRNQLVDELEKTKIYLTENLQKIYEEKHKASLERIGSSLEGFQNNVRILNLEINRFTEKLQEVDIDRINEESPKLGQTMSELSNGISSVNNQLPNVSSALSAAVEDLGTLSNSAEKIQIAQLDFEKVVSRTIQLTESLEEANKAANDGEQNVSNRLSDLDTAFKEVTEKTEGLSKAAESLQSNFEQNAMDVVKFLRDKNRQ